MDRTSHNSPTSSSTNINIRQNTTSANSISLNMSSHSSKMALPHKDPTILPIIFYLTNRSRKDKLIILI